MDSRVTQVALVDLLRAEQLMVVVRWIAVPWALLQVLTYSDVPYPPGIKTFVLMLVALLALGNAAAMVLRARVRTLPQARLLAFGSLALDVLVISGIVVGYAFDPGSALWAVLFVLGLEGALRFQLAGALGAWAATAIIYTGREIWGSDHYGYPLQWNSITFRMGIGLIIALVAGLMARDLTRERQRLSHALAELSRVDATRSALVSTLAHDVRTPLTAIRGVVQTLKERFDSVDEDTRRRLLDAADRQTDRLTRMSTDLLELARLEQGRLDLDIERVSLREVLDASLSYVQAEAQIETDVASDLVVRADPQRLQQVLVNLATNALKHGEPPFRVEGQLLDGYAELAFLDGGPGVPPDMAATIFEPFRARSTETSVGLGLAIVKALVEAQGGTVAYEPNRPRGARFAIRLPAG